MKVTQLAKELGVSPREVLRVAAQKKIRLKSVTAKIDPQSEAKIRYFYAESKKEQEEVVVDGEKMIIVPEQMLTIKSVSEILGVSFSEVMKLLLEKGMTVNLNSEVDQALAIEIAKEFNAVLEFEENPETNTSTDIEKHLKYIRGKDTETKKSALIDRPPVITVMGHVDHGKTLLLDEIRKTNIVEKEAGGITQHIGAYQVNQGGKKLTFLDTPGHAAFTAIRARGARVTDLVVLVVASDESVKPQTIEALNHAKAAEVPIVVALNKIDSPESNIEQCKKDLADNDLLSEDWGGKIAMIPVSAKTGKGIKDLLEIIQLETEMLELKASFEGPAHGVVIESRLSRKKGPVATLLVQTGTLKIGNNFAIGGISGKIRALLNENGDRMEKATPGTPVEILGLSDVPKPGELLEVYLTEKESRGTAQKVKLEEKETAQQGGVALTLQEFSDQAEGGQLTQLNIILKADVNGSLEALTSLVEEIASETVSINVVHAATGPVNENDVMLSQASSAIIFAFGVDISSEAKRLSEDKGIQVRSYTVIYEIVEDIKKVISGYYKPEYEEVEIGVAEVRNVFKFSKVGTIAGCYVTEGKMTRNGIAVVFRDDKEFSRGKIDSLKRFKEDVKEVLKGFECGIVISALEKCKEDDLIKCYEVQEKKKK